ncbi:MAG TPA: glycoside hydrolase family 27 protein [Terracidiphilus sp.]|nr:glycoside hydrolase family 27 protein [Terracidiphilus sp.]
MIPRRLLPAAVLLAAFSSGTLFYAQALAPTPPMGWNSWDSYGLTIDEDQFKANAAVLARLRQYGWQYAVIDEGWYMVNPSGKTVEEKQYLWNPNGLLVPAPGRFPSAANGAGFKPIADWVHAQGLKFGIHIIRGIPRQVVAANLPIAGTAFTAADAADTTSPCPWDQGNWGIKDNAAGQAYYDSMLKLYAAWGLDFIKVDCISDRPYRPTEIRQIADAIRKTGRPIVLSLSPGPTALEHAAEVAKSAQMWRITDDHWDGWTFPHTPDHGEFPFGLRSEFDRLAQWYVYTGPGNWPDPDMLPIGYLGPNPGLGEARQSRYTPDEERTEFTLWAVTRSPLILGANLTRLDDFTRSLLTNQDVLFMNQNVTYSHPLDSSTLGPGFENARVWRATINEPGARGYAEYFGFFNLADQPLALRTTWKQLGLDNAKHSAQSLWDDTTTKDSKEISVTLPAHGSALYKVR